MKHMTPDIRTSPFLPSGCLSYSKTTGRQQNLHATLTDASSRLMNRLIISTCDAHRWRASSAGNILDRLDQTTCISCSGEICFCSAPDERSARSTVNVVHFLRSFTSLSRQPFMQLLLLTFTCLVLYRAGAAASAQDGYGVAQFLAYKYSPVGVGEAGDGACRVVAFRLTRSG